MSTLAEARPAEYDPGTMDCVFGWCGHTATHQVTVEYLAASGDDPGFSYGPRPYCRSCLRTEQALTRVSDSRVVAVPILKVVVL